MKIVLKSGYTIHISEGNMKTGNIPSFSLPAGKTCSKSACETCFCSGCYARKMERIRPSVRTAYQDNLDACMNALDEVREALNYYFDAPNAPRFFRIHVGGDFFSAEYMAMWIDVIRAHPGTKFLAFTKQFVYARKVCHAIPENFSLTLSAWPGLEVPEIGLPIAWMDDGTDDRIPADAIPCSGNCVTCGCKCWCLGNRDVVFKKH